ncbi:MAG: hypothetical protein P8I94_11365 [Emcibacteraceae bacterium]|nr:hypothetical protein [Emcibacteraceae bacterium]
MHNRTNFSFPSMFVSEKEKNEEWCSSVIDAIMNYLTYDKSPLRDARSSDIRNYSIYNGNFVRDDFKYITEQYGVAFPARLVNYPIIQPKIDLLVGEEIKRPLDYKVTTINKESILRKENMKVSLIARQLMGEIKEEIKKATNVDVDIENENIPLPDDVDVFMRYNYKELIEEIVQDGLEYLTHNYHLKDVFKNGFRDLLVTGKEFFKTYIKDGDPYVRRVDPRSIVYDLGSESDYLDDSAWVGEERWLTASEILDEYREELTQDQVEKIYEMMNVTSSGDTEDYNSELQWVDYNMGRATRIRVVIAEWKSVREVKYKVSPNKHDESRPFKKLVGDGYKKKKGEKIEIKYIDDIWEGTKIGGTVLVRCRRRFNQPRSVDDISKTKLSYVGAVKNRQTGGAESMVGLLKNVQMLYNIVMYHIELAMARSGGKAVIYDVAQLPENLGLSMEDVMYHMKTDGIIPINSKDEGMQAHTFNQFQQIDFTLSNSVQQLINLKLMLEDTAGQISGVTKQREGSISNYEYVGNVQRAVVQSATITEPWFYTHQEVKQRVYQNLADLIKLAWKDGKKAATVLGDGSYKFLSVLPEVALSDYGIYMGDSGKDEALKGMVTQFAQGALQSGSISLLDLIKVMKADTMTEAEKVLERGMEEMRKQQQEAAQQQQQQEPEINPEEVKMQIAQMNNQTDMQIAQMNNETKMTIKGIDSEDIAQATESKTKADAISQDEQASQQQQMQEKQMQQQQQRSQQQG